MDLLTITSSLATSVITVLIIPCRMFHTTRSILDSRNLLHITSII